MQIIAELHDEDVGEISQEVSGWKTRTAVRCILKREDRILLIHVQNRGYHKLPGGGIDEEEDMIQALRREIREETGSSIDREEVLGQVVEWKSHYGGHQISTCFIAVEKERGETHYTRDELDKGCVAEHHALKEATALLENERPEDYTERFMVRRDLIFLKEALKQEELKRQS